MLVSFLKLVLLGCCEQRDRFYMYRGAGGRSAFLTTMQSVVWVILVFLVFFSYIVAVSSL